jgi:heme-degrading monooxygenase HmoA
VIKVVVFVRIRPEQGAAFEKAFAEVRGRVAGSRGHIRDELLHDQDEAGHYLLIGEWESREAFIAWEDDPRHREQSAPMNPFWRDAQLERHIFDVRVGDAGDLHADPGGRAAPARGDTNPRPE